MASVVEVNPFTRVEGHGTLKVYLDGSRVERVELCLSESPRLFEALLVGRSYAEVPDIICRICSLCSTVHKVTALLAVERALDCEVDPITRLTRGLMLQGGQIQSHALHLYCLALPDLLELSGVGDLARQAPELLKTGLNIKRVGNLIQETVGGRLIHPVNITLGGLGQRVGTQTLRRLADELDAILPECAATYRHFATPFAFPPLPAPDFLALTCGDDAFIGDRLQLMGDAPFPVVAYRDRIAEEVLPHSHAKSAVVAGRSPCVGALARINLGQRLHPEAGKLLDRLRPRVIGQDMRANSLAQCIELYQAALEARELVRRLLEASDTPQLNRQPTAAQGTGSAACEAPRGVLIHSFTFDASGLCTAADVITPTSLNQGALERDLLALARGLEGAEQELLVGSLERLVRCYDPCISCAVHLVRI
jgi:sulfhydrogenase subunit alpha